MLLDQPAFQSRLLDWYDRHQRDLPWRKTPAGQPPDPYAILVSEAMLQQTQVATVLGYYTRFLDRFPTVQSLADADLNEVLRFWQGLGYYTRARNLHRAAQIIVRDRAGVFPDTVETLLALPGVGRYTAGAIASIAFGIPAPIVDGNVARILIRLDAIKTSPRTKSTLDRLWVRAAELVPRERPGDFNSAMMELGATVCTPRSPDCPACPVADHCAARAAGIQDRLPAPKRAKVPPLEKRTVHCVEHRGQFLIERRPDTGRWAGLWQFPTREAGQGFPVRGVRLWMFLADFTHALTHRRYRFMVFKGSLDVLPDPLPAGLPSSHGQGVPSAQPLPAPPAPCTQPLPAPSASDSQTPPERDTPSVPVSRGRPAPVPAAQAANPIPFPHETRWVSLADLGEYPMSRPHQRIAELLLAHAPRQESPPGV